MENKLIQLALEQYATKYSDLLVKKLFADKKSISGNEIMDEIPVKQVGLFVLFNLYKTWKMEVAQLKSPYFDYKNPDVQLRLEELMNALSKHISVSREHFYPLLVKSVESTLLLILSPLKYYEDLVESFNGLAPNLDEVKDLQRFIKINNHMRDALLNAWASDYSGDELFNKAFEGLSEPPEDVTELIIPFNDLVTIDPEKFWLGDKIDLEEESEVKNNNDLIEEDENEEADFETIHTQFAGEKTTLLADSLGFEASEVSIKSMLTINQKFMFVNDLFDGNKEDFNKVIDFLDSCETKDVIIKFVHNNYIERGNWKAEAPQVKEFMALVNKKFS